MNDPILQCQMSEIEPCDCCTHNEHLARRLAESVAHWRGEAKRNAALFLAATLLAAVEGLALCLIL